MANKNKPAGFKPVGNINGSGWNNQFRAYWCAPAADNPVFVGTPVQIGGPADARTASRKLGLATVQKAPASGPVLGVVVGIQIPDPYGKRAYPGYLPAGESGMVFVCDDPGAIFEVQSDGVITIGGMDDTFGHTVTSANTTTGVCDQVLDASDTSDDLDAWRIVGFSQEIDNDPLAVNAKVHVIMNKHDRSTSL